MENKFVIILLIFLFGYGLYYGFGKLTTLVEEDIIENGEQKDNGNRTTPRRTTINEAQRVTTEANINAVLRAIETDFVLGNLTAGRILIMNNEIVEGHDIRATLPDNGILIVRDDGRIAFTIVDKGFCIVKGFEDAKMQMFIFEDDCSHPDVE